MSAIVQSVSAGSPDGSNVTTAAVDTTGADGIVVALSSYASNPSTGVTDNMGNTYSPLTGQSSSGGGCHIQLFYCMNPIVGAGHTWSNVGGQFESIAVLALSGSDISTFYDGVESTADGAQAGSIMPTQNGCILVAAFSLNGTADDYTIDGGFTKEEHLPLVGGQSFGINLGYLIQTTAAAANPTWSGTSTFAASAIAAFRGTFSGGGGGGGGETSHVYAF